MTVHSPLRGLKIRATTVAALLMAGLFGAGLHPSTVLAQSTIPANLTQLRPIKGISYQPSPSNDPRNGQGVTFDQDYWNTDFPALWGTDAAGGRNDLDGIKAAGLNLLHLYDWNAQRDHTPFLDAANSKGLKVMVPISNFTAQTIDGTTGCCPSGYQAAFDLVKGIFNNVYSGTTSPHPAVAMWGIFNEYDLNKIDPANAAFVVQAILTLEDQAGIPAADRLPITAPVSDATFVTSQRQTLSRGQLAAFQRATLQWLQTNPGKNVDTTDPPDLPGAVLAILAISNALTDAQQRTSYQSKFDSGPVVVSAVPADFWKTRFIASANPFRDGTALNTYLTDPSQFQSAFPGNTGFNTLPSLFFSEMGRAQADSGGDLQRQAAVVLSQIQCTHPLAVNAATPQGYFLGSVFFQHTLIDQSHYEGLAFIDGSFTTHKTQGNFPNQEYRVDNLTPLPVWGSVQTGYKNDTSKCQ
jgi:hypothetical protein